LLFKESLVEAAWKKTNSWLINGPAIPEPLPNAVAKPDSWCRRSVRH
jgi:hypothetical protein